MSGYEDAPEITFGDDALTADQAFARARRALETAELAVDEIERMDGAGELAAEISYQRILIGRGWVELGGELRRAER